MILTASLLGLSPSTLRRLEKDNRVEGYGLNVYYTPGGQRRYLYNELEHAYQKWGTFGTIGFGKKPCVIIRDLIRYFSDPSSVAAYPLEETIEHTQTLLDHAKEHQIPVIFVAKYYDPDNEASQLWAKKISTTQMLTRQSIWCQMDERIADYPFHRVIYTPYLSPFFRTNLDQTLNELGVDTVIVAGNSASGTIRMTVIEALQYGLRPIIPKEAVGDRTKANKQNALLEISAKYADVLPLESVLHYFQTYENKLHR